MITYIVTHLLLGIIGAAIVCRIEHNKGLDYTINDFILSLFAVLCFGPFLFAIAILYSFGEPSMVLIKGKEK